MSLPGRVVALCVSAVLVAPALAAAQDEDGVDSTGPRPNSHRALTHEELLAIRGERDRFRTWGPATLVAETVIERDGPIRGPAEPGQGWNAFGTLPRSDSEAGDPAVLVSKQVAAMFPGDDSPVRGLLAFTDDRSVGLRTPGAVETPNGTYLTPIEPGAMAVADGLPVGSLILVRGWFTLLESATPCPDVPRVLDPHDYGGRSSPFVRCPSGWLTADDVTEIDPSGPLEPLGFGIPVQWGADDQFGSGPLRTSVPATTYLLRRVANPVEDATPKLGWKVIGRVGGRTMPWAGPPAGSDWSLEPGGLDWRTGMDRQPPADHWQIHSTDWAGGFASLHVGADRVMSSWVSADGRDWQGAVLPTEIRSVTTLLRLDDGLAIIANQEEFGETWRWETWRSADGLEWKRTSREDVPMPERFEGRRRVVQGFWSLGDQVVALATYTTTRCCGRSTGWSVVAAQDQQPDAVFTWSTKDGRKWSRKRTKGIPQGGELHFGGSTEGDDGELLTIKVGLRHPQLLRTTDGIRWRSMGTLPASVEPYSPMLIERVGDGLVLVGQAEVEDRNRYRVTSWFSADGDHWIRSFGRFGGRPVDIASSGDAVVVAGNDGYSRGSGERPWLMVSTDGGRSWDDSLGWIGSEELCLESLTASGRTFSLDARCAPPDGATTFVASLPLRSTFREELMDWIDRGQPAGPPWA